MRYRYLASIGFCLLALSACGGGSSPTTTVAPVVLSLVADDASVSWNKPSNIVVLQNDSASRGSLTLSAVGAPAHGIAKLLGNAIEYTPNAGYFGPDTLSYTAQGEGGVQASSSVNIKVSADLKISG
ncbi:MAG: Ig-like domain-containing protein, partial [Burkholderiales bacterium]|nr:Ig-like domain-containing protein [Burkholderiales bacterium]